MNKKRVIYVAVALMAILAVYFFTNKRGANDSDVFIVARGSVSEEIFETGTVKKGETLILSFKESGRVASVFVSKNDTVEKGDVIAVLERGTLDILLSEAKEAISSAEASLQRLLAGNREEDVNVARAAVSSAQDAVSSAERSLSDAQNLANDTLSVAYRDVSVQISSIFMDIRVTFEGVDDFVDDYFSGFLTLETIKGRKGRDKISFALSDVNKYRDILEEDFSYTEQDIALSDMKEALRNTLSGLEDILVAAESDFYKDRIPSAEIDALRLRRTKTITDLNTVSSLIQGISQARNSSSAGVNVALAAVSSAQGALDRAEKDLERVLAMPLDEEIKIQESAVRRAESSVDLLNERIKDLSLVAPFSGRVVDVFGKTGEVVSAGTPFISFISDDVFYIETYIYERDVVKINRGDMVIVNLVPFPDQDIKGEILFINETGKLINNVVYYEAKISMDETPPRTMVEMSADLIITGNTKEDALVVPDRYLYREEGKRMVKVVVNGEIETRIVETGIRSSDGMVEVVSGLEEGEVITL